MSIKLSDKEKQILKYIILNCEIYDFSEDEALKYIKDNFSRPISRRTYYSIKHEIIEQHKAKSFSFQLLNMRSKNKMNLAIKSLRNLSLLNQRDDIVEEGLKNNIELDEFNKVDNLRLFFQKLHNRAEIFIENTHKFIDKKESQMKLTDKKYSSIPDHSIIRKEYVKCGKDDCLSCNHGPYFYAYWKDENGKLKKKYIGRNNPKKKDKREI